MRDGKRPDPDVVHPIAGYEREIYVKPTVQNPNILVGEFTYIADSDFESHVTHHYEWNGDKLIIGKFCQIAAGVGQAHRRDQRPHPAFDLQRSGEGERRAQKAAGRGGGAGQVKGHSGEGICVPQMNKGGKYIFGKSILREDGSVQVPPEAIAEYHITEDGRVYLFTGSKSTGGFCVTRKGLLYPSKLGHILTETPVLLHDTSSPGEFVRYKGRFYCWTGISEDGKIILSQDMMRFLDLAPGMELLSIRSSDIAFTMGAKGPLLEKARNYEGEIPRYG